MNVTVVICTWNRARLLDQTLARLRDQTVPPGVGWELIVVNNNCTDDTDAVVGKYAGPLPVRLVHEPRPGKVHALNAAVRAAAGRVLMFTDDDALVQPEWMTETLAAFDRHRADMVFGKVLPWWETEPPRWYSGLFDGAFALLDAGDRDVLMPAGGLTPFGVNYSFRRDVFDRIGGFSERLAIGPGAGVGCGGEDDEIYARMLAHGLTVVYAPGAAVRHYIPAARCEKRFNRRRAWVGASAHVVMLRLEADQNLALPRLGGIPRYVYRVNLGYLRQYLAGVIRRQPSRAFFYELKAVRFAAILHQLWRDRRRAVPATPLRTVR